MKIKTELDGRGGGVHRSIQRPEHHSNVRALGSRRFSRCLSQWRIPLPANGSSANLGITWRCEWNTCGPPTLPQFQPMLYPSGAYSSSCLGLFQQVVRIPPLARREIEDGLPMLSWDYKA